MKELPEGHNRRTPLRGRTEMRRQVARFVLAIVFAGCAGSPVLAYGQEAAASGDDNWRQQVQAWRAQREHELMAPDGWLSLVGLEWLKPGVNSFGSAADNSIKIHTKGPDHAGLLTVSGPTVQLLAPRGGFPEGLQVDGKSAREGTMSTSSAAPSTLTWHGVSMVVLSRGDRFALRVKDADSPTRTEFRGLHWYPADARYRVVAKWTPYSPMKVEKIPTVIGTTLDMPAPGFAEFTLAGKTVRLEPVIEGGERDKLFFILRDATSRTTTYQAARFLHTGLPSVGIASTGTLILDFNELYNPPWAYTPFATCPLPPEQNRLEIPIEAGEERYSH